MAESWLYPITWAGVWRANGDYFGASTPIRVGGSTGYATLVGIQKTAMLDKMNLSSIAPRVYLNIYSTFQADSVVYIGFHQETGNKASAGVPFYSAANIGWTVPLGWSRLDITNFVMSNTGETSFKQALENGYQGLAIYGIVNSKYGEMYGVTNNNLQAVLEVEGQWNTPPGKPVIITPTAGTKVQDIFELKTNAAVDGEQPSSEIQYEWSIEDGLFRYYFGWGVKGKTNLLLDFNQFNETTNARASVRAFDGFLAGQWSYSDRFTIMKNQAPFAPTLISPVGGETKDRTQTIVFNWKHNDAGEQSKADFRWRQQGQTTWNLITNTTNQQLLAVAASTFPVGTIEWNVRTFDDKGLVGPYSANAVFVSAAPSGAPLITAPTNGSTITASRVTVSWSAAGQTDYELQLVLNSVVVWTEQLTNTVITTEIPYDLENEKSYTIFLRVKTTDSAGLWSPWASTLILVTFTPPIPPLVTFDVNNNDGAIILYILNYENGGGEPNILKNDVYRRVYGKVSPREEGATAGFIRIAAEVDKNGSYVDYTPMSGLEYEYIVRGFGVNGTISDSNVIIAQTTIKHAILCVASDPANFIRLKWNPERSVHYERQMAKLQFNGREYPVVEYSPFARRQYSLSFDFDNINILNNFLDFTYQREVLLYRDGRGRRDFIAIETIDVKEKKPSWYHVTVNPERVDYDEEV